MNRMHRFAVFILLISLIIPVTLVGQSVVGTVHNLSVGGSGTVTATSESEVCIFCHTPHASSPSAPLWNKDDPGSTYTLYNSSTLQAIPGQPDGSAILCLSCHDGTIALGNLVSRTTDIDFSGGITSMPSGESNLTTDLSDDHPVSFSYTPTLAATDGQLKDPSTISMPVQLENGKVQCISCHDPHENTYSKFLVASNQFSDLCFRCHDRNFWSTSSHSLSNATWNGSGTDPWQHIEFPYSTVTENACENCHDPHNSGGKLRLLKAAAEESNCLDCHSGNVASTDIQTQTLKTYTHNVYGYNQIHDPTEAALPISSHVECQDCHNPHAVNNGTAIAPFANGTLTGIQGVDQSGNPVSTITYEYELCNRCHSTNAVTASYTSRQLGDNNVVNDFNPTNISHHGVVAPGNNPSPRGLIAPLTAGSQIYCTDCHASDGSGTPSGPHGSIYPRILKANYNLAEFTDLSNTDISTLTTEFALCAQCHDMNVVFDIHDTMKSGHVLKYTSCNTCHDPHGYSGGNTINNSFLINLSITALDPGSYIVPNGDGTGKCFIVCHQPSHHSLTKGSNYK